MSRQRIGLIWLLATIPLGFFIDQFRFVCDDAFIAFRFSENLANGLGLRYNLGVEPPVEGYTQLGWVLWVALLRLVGVENLVTGAQVSSMIFSGLLMGLVTRAIARTGAGTLATLAAALFFSTMPMVGAWSTGGLGTMAFSLFIFLTAERILGDELPHGVQAGLAGSVVAVLRADGVYWLFVLAVFVWFARRDRESRRQIRTCAAIVFTTAVALMLFRLYVHEDWLPNTVRAKVGMSAVSLERGLLYLCSFWAVVPAALIVALVTLLPAVRRGSPTIVRGALTLVLATFLFAVLVGGDFMAWHRFLMPSIAFLAVLVGALVQRLAASGRTSLALVTAALLIASSVPPAFEKHLVSESLRRSFHFRWGTGYLPEFSVWEGMASRAERWSRLGKALAKYTKPGDSIVMETIGAAGYYSKLFVYDRRGLVTREVNDVPIPPDKRTTPGHDRLVPGLFFDDREPTYFNGYIMPSNKQLPMSTTKWKILRFELSEEDGFLPKTRLVLARRIAPARRAKQ